MLAPFPGFIGPTYQAASPIADAERCVNWVPERVEPGATGQAPLWYRMRPGNHPFAFCRNGPIRGLYALNGRCFAVGGPDFNEVLPNGGTRQWGAMVNSPEPATLCSNGDGGQQVFIVSGGAGYIFNLVNDTLSLINPATTGFPSVAVMGAFVDGYFLVLEAHSGKFYLSSLEDGTAWSALDVAQVSESSNRITALIADHRIAWLFGQQTTEPWYNSGYANFPFQPNQGGFIESGILAPYSAVQLESQVFYLGGNVQGGGVVYRLSNPPIRVSTHAIEATWATYGALTNAIGWSYQEQGHAFYVLYFPTGPTTDADWTTWVYDLSTGLWHERGLYDAVSLRYLPDVGRCHTFAFGKHLVGDRATGTVYEMNATFTQDTILVSS